MTINERIEAALGQATKEDEQLLDAELLGYIVIAEYRRPDGYGAISRWTGRGQQSWTSQGYLSWATNAESLTQPVTGP